GRRSSCRASSSTWSSASSTLGTKRSRTRDGSVVTIGDMPEALLDRRRALVGAAVLVVVLALAGRTLLRPAHSSAPPPVRVATPARRVAAGKLYVDVVGAVRRPGLYRVPD